MGQAFLMHGVSPGTSLVDPQRFGRGNAFNLALLDEVRLKFGNPGQHRIRSLSIAVDVSTTLRRYSARQGRPPARLMWSSY